MNAFFLFIWGVLPTTMTQEIFFGQCPNVTPQKDFDPKRFSGEWFEDKRYRGPFAPSKRCNVIDYKLTSDGDTFVIDFKSVDVFGRLNSVDALARITEPKARDGSLTLTIPGVRRQSVATTKYNVIATDYDNYAVLFSCRNYLFVNFQNLWVLTRERRPDHEARALAKLQIFAHGLDVDRLTDTKHDICPVF